MKLSISNIAWKSEDDSKVYKLMKKYGYKGLEIAPTRVFPEKPYKKLTEAKIWSKELNKKYGFIISSMQSIWFGRQENIFRTYDEREILKDYTKQAINFAVMIGCKNLVFGCPKNRNLVEGADEEVAIDFFKSLGDYAYNLGTVIGMEANPPIYNTNYINDTKSALNLIQKVNSKGFLLNLDIGTVLQNKESLYEIEGKVKYINHIHISEPGLKIIEKRKIHKQLKEILIDEDYNKYISIEMSKTENLNDLEKIMHYVREVLSNDI